MTHTHTHLGLTSCDVHLEVCKLFIAPGFLSNHRSDLQAVKPPGD